MGEYRYLSKIESPADLRKLAVEELPAVCSEIREFLIEKCSEHPGHFASSMGAVEIVVALHYVYDTPMDKLVWDVGHQAYAHKVLTGRMGEFDRLREYGGMSGFPTPAESDYDTFTAGHASNSISAALGMSVAMESKGEGGHVVAVIGDASISGGLAFEGMNNAANTRNNLLIVLNDNDMSIDRSVGSLNSYMAHLTTSPAYNRMRYRVYKMLRRVHLVSEKGRGAILRFNNSLKSLLVREQNIFEGLNIRYFGVFDGHDVVKIVRVLRDIKEMEGPRILHLRTVKGKGYEAAERDPAKWHAPGRFDAATGVRRCDVTGKKGEKYQDVFGKTLLELAKEDERIVGVTAAMPSGTSMSVLQQAMPARVYDVGISEGHAVTFAGGMAKEGMLPFVAIYSSFLQRGYDHIIHDVAMQGLPVTFCIDRAGLVGEDGMTHHGAYDVSYLRCVPNMIVSAPSSGEMLKGLMHLAAGVGQPMAIRYPRGAAAREEGSGQSIRVGKGRVVIDTEKADVAILSFGAVLTEVMVGCIDGVMVCDMIFAKPLDGELLDKVSERTDKIITVEDGCVTGGFGSAVAEYYQSRGKHVSITMLGIPDRFVKQGTPAQLRHECGYDSEGIRETIKRVRER